MACGIDHVGGISRRIPSEEHVTRFRDDGTVLQAGVALRGNKLGEGAVVGSSVCVVCDNSYNAGGGDLVVGVLVHGEDGLLLHQRVRASDGEDGGGTVHGDVPSLLLGCYRIR